MHLLGTFAHLAIMSSTFFRICFRWFWNPYLSSRVFWEYLEAFLEDVLKEEVVELIQENLFMVSVLLGIAGNMLKKWIENHHFLETKRSISAVLSQKLCTITYHSLERNVVLKLAEVHFRQVQILENFSSRKLSEVYFRQIQITVISDNRDISDDDNHPRYRRKKKSMIIISYNFDMEK